MQATNLNYSSLGATSARRGKRGREGTLASSSRYPKCHCFTSSSGEICYRSCMLMILIGLKNRQPCLKYRLHSWRYCPCLGYVHQSVYPLHFKVFPHNNEDNNKVTLS